MFVHLIPWIVKGRYQSAHGTRLVLAGLIMLGVDVCQVFAQDRSGDDIETLIEVVGDAREPVDRRLRATVRLAALTTPPDAKLLAKRTELVTALTKTIADDRAVAIHHTPSVLRLATNEWIPPRWDDKTLMLRHNCVCVLSNLHRKHLGKETQRVFPILVKALQNAPTYWPRVRAVRPGESDEFFKAIEDVGVNFATEETQKKYEQWKKIKDLERPLEVYCASLAFAMIRCREEKPVSNEAIAILSRMAKGNLAAKDADGKSVYAVVPVQIKARGAAVRALGYLAPLDDANIEKFLRRTVALEEIPNLRTAATTALKDLGKRRANQQKQAN